MVPLLFILACEQSENSETYQENRELLPDPEGNKKDTLILANNSSLDPCNFEKYFKDVKTPKLAKTIYLNKEWNLNDDIEVLSLLDSLTADDKGSRPFYFKVVTISESKCDGYYAEGLGLAGKEYVENNTKEFLNNFNTNCFSDQDLEIWEGIVLLELGLAEDDTKGKRVIHNYIKILNEHCIDCTADQKSTLKKFSDGLITKWDQYLKEMNK